MTPPVVLAFLGLGVLLATERRPASRENLRASPMTPRERAIEAQLFSARAATYARDVAAQWTAEEDARQRVNARGV